jgi:hypothetical protein
VTGNNGYAPRHKATIIHMNLPASGSPSCSTPFGINVGLATFAEADTWNDADATEGACWLWYA